MRVWGRKSVLVFFGLMFMGSVMSICSSSCVLYSAGSGMKRVHVILYGSRMRLFV